MKVLIIEDEKLLADSIQSVLERKGFEVECVYDGETGAEYAELGIYDLLILDVMMPKMNGCQVAREVRAKRCGTPILMLTARSELEDRIEGLNAGADYYLTKPFDTKELLATLRAITRSRTSADSKLTFGCITLDRSTFTLSSPTGSFRLANKEFQMCELLMANPHHIIPAERFLEKIWGYESETEITVVWVYISYLRKKLTALHADIQIQAHRNAGYSLEEAP